MKRAYVTKGKKALKKLWEKHYKSKPIIRQESVTPKPPKQIDYLEAMLNGLAPTKATPVVRSSSRRD
ncbi:hypothetical protein ACEPPN_010902 [Leptodophora sp. 'Broadleaf-Isolate-01']